MKQIDRFFQIDPERSTSVGMNMISSLDRLHSSAFNSNMVKFTSKDLAYQDLDFLKAYLKAAIPYAIKIFEYQYEDN